MIEIMKEENMKERILLFKNILNDSLTVSRKCLSDTEIKELLSQKESIEAELDAEKGVKVPIIGDFNAGKSTLLNAYIGRKGLLPTNIEPTTAVAYELYYSENEKAELYRNGEKIDECGLESLSKFNSTPGDISKVYINSSIIKNLNEKGIVLVDMPGIGSGVEAHNMAISQYISKGSSFVVVVDAEQGTIGAATLSFMSELSHYNLKPAVIISKCDKKPADELAGIKETVSYLAKKSIGTETFVGSVSSAQDNVSDLSNFIDTLDSASIVRERFGKKVEGFIEDQIQKIVLHISALKTDIEDVSKAIGNLEKKKTELSTQLNGDSILGAQSPEDSANDVVYAVEQSLRAHLHELACAMKDGSSQSELSDMVLSIVRPAIIDAFKEEGEQYASALNSVVDDVAYAIQDNIEIDTDLISELADKFRGEIEGMAGMFGQVLINMGGLAQVLGTILIAVKGWLADLIKIFFGKSDDEKIAEIQTKLADMLVPNICKQLYPSILSQVKMLQERIRKSIEATASNQINDAQKAISSTQNSMTKDEIEAKIAQYETAVEKLKAIKTTV